MEVLFQEIEEYQEEEQPQEEQVEPQPSKKKQGVKGYHNKALRPLIVNLHGLDKCLIA